MQRIHVMAGALVDADGRVLIALRPAHKHQGGRWEFPGGKRELGEGRRTALARELHEEIGIEVVDARPLISVVHRYPEREVTLDVWRVDRWRGEAHGREGQPVEWVDRSELGRREFPPADWPVLGALALPSGYLVTPDLPAAAAAPEFLARLEAQVQAHGIRLVQLRVKSLPRPALIELAGAAAAICHRAGARLLLNAGPDLAEACGADGVHLSGARLTALRTRPLGAEQLVGASCHGSAELRQALRIEADFAVLAPVLPTASHPGAPHLGWQRFERLVAAAGLPVFALGGVGPPDLQRAWQAGAQGVAAIRGFWESADPSRDGA